MKDDTQKRDNQSNQQGDFNFDDVFRVSSFCGSSSCVAVAIQADKVRVRQNQSGATVTFTRAEWSAFVKGVKNNEFDSETK